MDKYRLAELERRAANTVLVGKVDSVSGSTARVAIGELLTTDLPVLSFRALSEGDPVLVIAHNGDLAQAFVVGSLNNNTDFFLRFADGTEIGYDQATKQLKVSTTGALEATAQTAAVQAPIINLTGNVTITGTLNVAGLATLATATVGGVPLVSPGDSF
jgi:phage baseplate assembly protein V